MAKWNASVGLQLTIDYDDIEADTEAEAIQIAKERALEDIEWNNCDCDASNPIVFMYPGGIKRPPYQPGDILYVRETWCALPVNEAGHMRGHSIYYYRADGDLRPEGWRGKWRPSIHMPKEAARIWLKVTDVRVERLQDITPKGAESEGVGNLFYDDIGYGEKNYGTEVDTEYGIAKEQFAWLWESTIKKSDLDRYGWDANPWVWVIEFERCEKPEEI